MSKYFNYKSMDHISDLDAMPQVDFSPDIPSEMTQSVNYKFMGGISGHGRNTLGGVQSRNSI